MLCVNSSSFQGLELWVIFFTELFKKENKILFLVKDKKILEEGRIYKKTKKKEGRREARQEGKKRG